MRGHRHHGHHHHHHHHGRRFLFGRRWRRPFFGGCGIFPLLLFFFCILPLFMR